MPLWNCRRAISFSKTVRYTQFSTSANLTNEVTQSSKCRTGILILGSGNPTNDDEIKDYFIRTSLDKNISSYPFQKYLGPFLAERNISKFLNQNNHSSSKYGASELVKSQKLAYILDVLSPDTAPHMTFVGYQYTHPFIEETLKQMEIYDVERAVAIPMLPHYSCSYTGSVLNMISNYNKEKREPSKTMWSAIDRWSSHPAFINSFVKSIKDGLSKFPEDIVKDTLIVFSALSTPLMDIYKGDSYYHEVAASIYCIMEKLNNSNPFIITWHSLAGPMPWLGPETRSAMKSSGLIYSKGILLVPISFVSDNVLADVEYFTNLPKHCKMIHRSETPASSPIFIKDLAQLISTHLQSGSTCTKNLYTGCINCSSKQCVEMRQYFRMTQEAINISKENSAIHAGWSQLKS